MISADFNTPDEAWDAFVERHPDGHILQTSAWANCKSSFGWSAGRVAILDGKEIVAGASTLFRHLPFRLGTLAYVPKGPVVDWQNAPLVSALFDGLDALCRTRRAFAAKIEPDVEERIPLLDARRSMQASRPIQPRRTILIDLSRSEDNILAAMHQKTRYNIRLAARKNVVVRQGSEGDLPAFNALVQETGARDGFGVHSPDYYRALFESFVPRGWGQLFVAQVDEPGIDCKPVAAVLVLAFGRQAWYLHGASSNEGRERMPNHALQWEAIRWAKARGCTTYDLWGVPDEDEATLEAQYLERSDGLWGVYRFKRGFGGRLARYVGAFDRVYNPLLYQAFLFALERRDSLGL